MIFHEEFAYLSGRHEDMQIVWYLNKEEPETLAQNMLIQVIKCHFSNPSFYRQPEALKKP